ncbi:DUF3078 domain-containing protein [Fodinibius salsisoli]|uniref:DUF3078 domain-containing protein n=1 Tax=Fodinibius salsisoli TaxID=2820877 RepID=A0ABT3PID7_9BACT|nr:DUF3078 domain-containing protein [Fodinibius salsisoli]MCW9705518.1 DUF3078 domain-containing protein [Fodinibius salsisoli]
MKKTLLLIFIIAIAASTNQLKAQEITFSDTLSGWDYSWVAGLNGSQASYSNWAKGGVNNISGNAHSAITGKYREGRFSYGSLLSTRYGKSKIEDQGTRKTDDLLLLKNRFLYNLAKEESDFSLFGNIDFRTQFDKGFEYGAGPEGGDVLISKFMAPAYFSQNAGLAYVPNDIYSFEAGLGMQQTIVTDDNLATVYGLDEGSNIRNEAGITLGASYEHPIVKNFVLSSSLESFTNVNRAISSTDIYFSNQLTGKINSFMNTSLRFELVYDDDFSEEVQMLQVLSLGVSFILI